MHQLSPSSNTPDSVLDNYLFILGSNRMPDAMIQKDLYDLMRRRSEIIIEDHGSGTAPVSDATLQKARIVLRLAGERLAILEKN